MSNFTYNASCNINTINNATVPGNFTTNTQDAWCGFNLPGPSEGNIAVLTVNTGPCCVNASGYIDGCFTYCPVEEGSDSDEFQRCLQNGTVRSDGEPVGDVAIICTQKVRDEFKSSGGDSSGDDSSSGGDSSGDDSSSGGDSSGGDSSGSENGGQRPKAHWMTAGLAALFAAAYVCQ